MRWFDDFIKAKYIKSEKEMEQEQIIELTKKINKNLERIQDANGLIMYEEYKGRTGNINYILTKRYIAVCLAELEEDMDKLNELLLG